MPPPERPDPPNNRNEYSMEDMFAEMDERINALPEEKKKMIKWDKFMGIIFEEMRNKNVPKRDVPRS